MASLRRPLPRDCLLAPCGREGVPPPQRKEEKTAQVTVWSERFEIFLEHRVLVVKIPTKFITHVTDLATLEPRREEGPLSCPPAEHRGTQHPGGAGPSPRWHLSPRAHVSHTRSGVSPCAFLDGQEFVVTLPPLTVFASQEEAKNAPESTAPDGISFSKSNSGKS